MRLTRLFLLILSLAISPWAGAVDATLAPAGFTGVGITPNARLLDWGTLGVAYDNQLPGFPSTKGHNFVVGFGLFPNVEISGRMASNNFNNNCFSTTIPCGARDLSANFKAGIGLDGANHWRIAAGASDLGGQVNYVSTYYGVLTYSADLLETSAGVARRRGAGIAGSKSPLHGPFANAVVQPFPWVQGHVEYSDGNAWAGAKVFAPSQWLPSGWSAYAGVNARLNQSTATEKTWFNLGVTIPLYRVPRLPDQGPRTVAAPIASGTLQQPSYPAIIAPPAATAPAPIQLAPTQFTEAKLQALAHALQARGLEDISVGRMPDESIAIRANNATYNWNSVDALGVALGVLSRELGEAANGYRLILTQRQTPIVGATGQANCLRQWIDGAPATCTAGQLFTPGTMVLDELHLGATWTVRNQAPSWTTLRLALSPALRTTVGTEFGVLDYSAAVRVGVQMPLWPGAIAEARPVLPVAQTEDFKAGGVFAARRITARVDRALISQVLQLRMDRILPSVTPAQSARWGISAVTAQVHAGRINDYFDGALGELRWEPGEGRHRVTAQAGRFIQAGFSASTASFEPRVAKPILASYRYSFAPTRTYLEATVGQYMNNDRGGQVGLTQWFSDVGVSLYYRRSEVSNTGPRNFIGIALSLPLGPRKDVNPGNLLQVTGTPRFRHGVETLVKSAFNFITPGYGVLPDVPSLDQVFNSDRSGLVYLEDNMRRIRDAAR